jgi:hypothetical protein
LKNHQAIIGKEVSPAMRIGVLTRGELMLPGKFEAFHTQLIDYLRRNLVQVPRFPDAQDSEVVWVCPEVCDKIWLSDKIIPTNFVRDVV